MVRMPVAEEEQEGERALFMYLEYSFVKLLYSFKLSFSDTVWFLVWYARAPAFVHSAA